MPLPDSNALNVMETVAFVAVAIKSSGAMLLGDAINAHDGKRIMRCRCAPGAICSGMNTLLLAGSGSGRTGQNDMNGLRLSTTLVAEWTWRRNWKNFSVADGPQQEKRR